jgi:hypothetical protein
MFDTSANPLTDLEAKVAVWWNDWLNMTSHLRDGKSLRRVWRDVFVVIEHGCVDLNRQRIEACGQTASNPRMPDELANLTIMVLACLTAKPARARAVLEAVAGSTSPLTKAICKHALQTGDQWTVERKEMRR